MYKLYPYFTNDGSVGLFSPADDDIYHSTLGAATEAYEKFILPAEPDKFFADNKNVKILDICFGIGYNTKSFLNYFLNFEKKYLKFSNLKIYKNNLLSPYNDKIYTYNTNYQGYNEQIYTHKISDTNYSGKIYSDNISDKIYKSESDAEEFQIYIKAIDTDKNLAFLSPFILSKGKIPYKNYKLPFENEKITKYLNFKSKNIYDKNFIIYPDEINIILLDKICRSHPEIFESEDINSILNDKNFSIYFNPYIINLFKLYCKKNDKNTPKCDLGAFLHNIYYNHLSKRYKRALNSLINKSFYFDLKISDARAELLSDNNLYDYIFLDAFTPAKCPALWTIDFFKLLFEHLSPSGRLLTYSNSAAVRNAMINAGFYAGKIYNEVENKFTGTIAVKNKSLIKYELSEYDLGLLKTKAGIFYRDENLTALNEEIIRQHQNDVRNSSLMSSSKYIKSMRYKS